MNHDNSRHCDGCPNATELPEVFACVHLSCLKCGAETDTEIPIMTQANVDRLKSTMQRMGVPVPAGPCKCGAPFSQHGAFNACPDGSGTWRASP